MTKESLDLQFDVNEQAMCWFGLTKIMLNLLQVFYKTLKNRERKNQKQSKTDVSVEYILMTMIFRLTKHRPKESTAFLLKSFFSLNKD